MLGSEIINGPPNGFSKCRQKSVLKEQRYKRTELPKLGAHGPQDSGTGAGWSPPKHYPADGADCIVV